jgi:hypothetical protein
VPIQYNVRAYLNRPIPPNHVLSLPESIGYLRTTRLAIFHRTLASPPFPLDVLYSRKRNPLHPLTFDAQPILSFGELSSPYDPPSLIHDRRETFIILVLQQATRGKHWLNWIV